MTPVEPTPIRSWLDSHINLEAGVGAPPAGGDRKPRASLERMRRLLALLGSPEQDFRAIHVAGTTGKTSTTRMVTQLMRAAGLSVGTYTSPHLETLEERITYDGEPIESVELDGALEIIRAVEDDMPEPPSFFEIVTAAAFREFADLAVDVAVIEVGLGGEWDATNLAHSSVIAVTNVSVDHTEYFGETLPEIAISEAAVVEPNVPLVLGVTDPLLAAPFLDRGAYPIVRRDVQFGARPPVMAHGGYVATYETPRAVYEDVFLALHGVHQVENAAIALATTEAFFGAALPEDVVRDAFGTITTPGRLEVTAHQPMVLLDGAHNVAGARALARSLADEFPAGPRVWVLGLLREKDPSEMIDALGVRAEDAVIVCRPPSPRALDPQAIAEVLRARPEPPRAVEVRDEPAEALALAREGAPEDAQVIVTGSLYLVGAARALLH